MSWWRPNAFDHSDRVNQEIWDRSPDLQIKISPPRAAAVGYVAAAQALVGPRALPWVPDLVGRRWKEPGSVLVIGSSYADFFSGYQTRRRFMRLEDYLKARQSDDFQDMFLRSVVIGDVDYASRGDEPLFGSRVSVFALILDLSFFAVVELQPTCSRECTLVAVFR